MIRVVLLCSSPAIRMGLRRMLEMAGAGGKPEIEVVFESESLDEIGSGGLYFDVLLVVADEPISGQDVLEMAGLFTWVNSGFSLLIITDSPTTGLVTADLEGRAWGVISLEAAAPELIAAVRAVHEGLFVASPSLIGAQLNHIPEVMINAGGETAVDLTDRESQVLQLLVRGLANKQIASELAISEHTVKFHVSAIYSKLGAANRAEAVRIGMQSGLVVL